MPKAVIASVVLLAGTTAALASVWTGLPIIDNTYGSADPEINGCQAYKEGTEGGYIGFDKSGWGAYGEVPCAFKSIKKTDNKKYAVTGTCTFGVGENVAEQTDDHTLEIIDNETIFWDGKKMVLCPPNPDEEEGD